MDRFFKILCLGAVILLGAFGSFRGYSQCPGFDLLSDGTVGSSISTSSGLCAPRTVTLTYSFGLTAPAPPAGQFAVFYIWNDGQLPSFTQVNLTPGLTSYSVNANRTFPVASDCEYEVIIIVARDGFTCNGFTQVQRVNSWRTDAFNGGVIALSPTPADFCPGINISQVFNDVSNWNCMRNSISASPSRPSTPNEQGRWQQLVYNTKVTPGARIPNVRVNGVAVTDAAGADIINNYQDPRGVFFMASPVVQNDPRRRNSLTITATGGYGPGFPAVGQIFEVTIRNWSFCNPYDNPALTGPPADLINGDSPPVESVAIIRIITNPPQLSAVSATNLCYGTALTNANTFAVSGTTGSTTGINWYNGDPLAGGTPVVNPLGSSSTTFRMNQYPTSAPGYNNAANPINTSRTGGAGGVYALWATQVYGGTNGCESQAVQITRIVRPQLTAPAVPTGIGALCNNTNNVNYSQPGAAVSTSIAANTFTNTGVINYPTEYFWDASPAAGVSFSSTTGTSVNVSYALAEPAPPTPLLINVGIRTSLRYTTAPQCTAGPASRSVAVSYTSTGGSISPSTQTICEGAAITSIVASNFRGVIQEWESDVNGSGLATDVSLGTASTITPSVPIVGSAQTVYRYRVVVQNSVNCATVFGPIATITVNPRPGTATLSLGTGASTICKGGSTNLKVTFPPLQGGTPLYTVVYKPTPGSNVTVNNYTAGADILVSPTVNTTYTLVSVTDSRSCTATSVTGSVPIVVRDLSASIAFVTSSSGTTSICPPANSVTLAFNVTDNNGNPLTTYTVNYQDNLAGSFTTGPGYVSGSPVVRTNIASSRTFTITSITDNTTGCTTSPNTGSVAITVGSTPASATFSGGGSVCRNSPFNLALNIVGGVAPYTIIVDNGIGTISNYTSGAAIPVPTGAVGTINYSVTFVQDACLAVLAGSVTNNPQSVTVNPLPTANNPTPTVCSDATAGTTATVNLTSNNAAINGGAVTITWFTGYNAGTGVFSGSIGTPTSFVVTGGTPVFARVLDGNGCVSPATVTYTVNPRPSPPSGATGSTFCSVPGTPSPISVTAPGGILTIDWYAAASGGAPLLSNSATFTPTAAGTYFAETRNTITSCVSTSRTPVISTIDTAVPAANAGPDQSSLCSSVSSVTLAGNIITGGVGGWTIPGQVSYAQNFTAFANGTTRSSAINGWSINVSGANVFTGGQGSFDVQSNRFAATNTNGTLPSSIPNVAEVVWNSAVANITGIASVSASVDLINVTNNLVGPQDYIRVFYKLNGGAEIAFPTNGNQTGNFVNTTASVTGLSGATLQIVVRVANGLPANTTAFDNLVIRSSTAGAIVFANPNSPSTTVTGLQAPAAGTSPITTTLRWTASSLLGACANTQDDVDITLNPAPDLNTPQTTIVCSGSPVNYNITLVNQAGFAGTTFSWPAPTMSDASVQGSAGSGVLLTATPHINDVLTNTSGANITATYTITPTRSGCVGTPRTVVVTVRPAPRLVIPQSKTICSGQPANYEIRLAPLNQPVGTTFSWPDPDGAGPGTARTGVAADPAGTLHITDVLTNTTPAPISVTYAITPTGPAPGSCVGATENVTITVNPLPVLNTISGQPLVCAGTSILLYQVTPNAGSTYAWTIPPLFTRFAGGNPGDFFVLLQFPSVGAGTLQMTETNSFGCVGPLNALPINVSSAPGALAINGPTVVCKSQTGVTFCVPGGVVCSPGSIFNASSTYTWTASGATIVGPASGVGLQTITVDFGLSSVATITVNEVSSSGCTGSPFTLNIAVGDRPVMISTNSTSVCSLSTPTLVFTSSLPSTFDWKITTITGSITSAVPGFGVGLTGLGNFSSTFTGANVLNNTSNAFGSVTFDVTPTGTVAPNCEGAPQSVTLIVNPTPVIPAQPRITCSGTAFTVAPVNGGATIVPPGTTYTWPAPTLSGGMTGGSAQAVGVASISQTLVNPTNVPQTATYNVTPTSGSSGACVGVPFVVTVTVNPTPVISNQNPPAICSGDGFSVTPVNGGATIVPAGTTYTWPAPVVTGGITGGSAEVVGASTIGETLVNPTNIPRTATYTVTPTSGAAGSCVGATFTVTVIVNPAPFVQPQTPAICSGTAFTVSPTNGGGNIVPASTTYTWPAPIVTGGITGSSAQAVGVSSISQTLVNPTNTPQTATYNVTPTSGAAGACVGASFTVTVTVNPTPFIQPQTPTICSGTSFTVSPTNGGGNIVPTGTTYTWPAPVVTGGMTGGSAQLTGVGAISQTLTNPTSSPQTATYTVTPTSGATGACVGASFSVTVTVDPRPFVQPQTSAICSGTAFVVSPTNGGGNIIPTGTTYTWPAPAVTGGITGGSAQAVGVSSISQTLVNPNNTTQTATYTVTPTFGSCVGATFTVTVSVNPRPFVQPQTPAVCSGTAFSVSPTDGGGNIVPASTTYTWSAPVVTGGITGGSAQAVGVASISQTLTNPTNTPQTATYTVTPTSGAAGSCVGATFTVTVTVNPRPFIQPQTPAICSGTAFTVTPTNGGGNIVPVSTTYTWPAPVVTGGITGGSAQAVGVASISQTLTNPTNIPQTATYTVTPTSGAAGSCVGATFTVTVSVNPRPFVQPQAPAVCSGTAFTVSPTDGGGNIVPVSTTYTWPAPVVTGGITGGSAQAVGVSSISQTLVNPTNLQQTATYTVTPTSGAAGSCVGATFTVTVSVNPRPFVQPQTPAVCSGTAFTVTPTDGGGNIVPASTTYTWPAPVVTGGITGGSAQAVGVASISQTLTNPTNTPQTATYTVTPTSGAAGSCVGATFTVTVTVNPRPFIQPQTPAICSGTAFTVTPTNGGGNLVPISTTYTWPAPVVTGGITGGGAQAVGVASISQTLTNPTNIPQTATYTVTPTSGAAGSCVGATFTVTVTVNPTPVIPAQPATICSGTSFTVTPANGGATIVPSGTTYTWPAPVVTGGITGGSAQAVGVASISQTLTNPTNTPQTATYTVTPTSGAAGSCVGATFTVTVTVNPTPVIPAQPRTICSGTPFTVTPVNGGAVIVPAGTTYTWPAPIVTGGITGGSAQAVGVASISQTLTNPTNTPQTATYTVTPTSGAAGSCVGATFTVTVTVNPTPVIPAQPATICSGTAFTVTPVNGGATIVPSGTTYTWPAPVVTGGITGGSAQAVGVASISQTLTNPTNIPQTATYTVTPTSGAAGSCVGATFTVTVTVNPTPVIPAQPATVCSGTAFIVTPANGGATIVPSGTTYTWPAPVVTGGMTGGVAQSTGVASITGTLVNISSANQTATYTVTPTSGASGTCVGGTFTVTVTVNPQPVATPSTTIQRCSGVAINADLNSVITNLLVPPNATNTFKYVVVADFPLDLAPAVFPGTFDRTTASGAPISETFSNYSNHDVTLTYTVTPFSALGCQGANFTYRVVYYPEPVGQNVNDPNCNTSINHNIQSQITNGITSAFTYTVTSTDLVNVPPAPNRTVPSVANITDSYTNTTGSVVTVTYTITPISVANNCTGVPFTYSVVISPKPVGSNTNPVRCSDVAFSFDPQLNISPTVTSTFTWTATYDGSPIAPGSGVINVPTGFTNTSNAVKQAIYTITPTAVGTGCVGLPFTITVDILPKPVMDPALALPPAVCSTNPVSSNIIGVVLGTNGVSIGAATYNITLKSIDAGLNPVTGPTVGTGLGATAIQNDRYSNMTATQLRVVYTVVPVSAGPDFCLGDPFDVSMRINPEPVVSTALDNIVCSRDISNIVLATNGSSVSAAQYVLVGVTVPGSITADPGNAAVNTIAGINLIKNDKYTNNTPNQVRVIYEVRGISPAPGNCLGQSRFIDLDINPAPVLNPALSPAPVCSGLISNVTLSVDPTPPGSVAAASYNITSITFPGLIAGGSNTGIGNGKPANAILNDVYTNVTNGQLSVTYSIAAVSAAGCVGSVGNVVLLIDPSPDLANNLNATVCSGATAGINLSVSNSVPVADYNLISVTPAPGLTPSGGNVTPGLGKALGALAGDIFTNTTNGVLTVTYRVSPRSTANCFGPAEDIILTVEPPIVATPTPLTSSVCSNSGSTVNPTNITLTSPTVPSAGVITFNYTAALTAGSNTSGFNPSLSSLPQGHVIQDNLVNNSNAVSTVTYTITPVANGARGGMGCVGTPIIVTVNVEPKPKLVAAPTVRTICEGPGANTNVALSSPTTPSSGTVEFLVANVVATGGVTGFSPAGTVFPNTSTLADVLSNPTSTQQTVTYNLRPRINGGPACIGDDVIVTINVNPRPNISAPAQPPICSGDQITIPITSDVAATVSTWTASATGGGTVTGASSGAGDQIFAVLFNNGNQTETVTYTVTPQAAGCSGTPLLVTVQVNPKAKVTGIPTTVTVCHGSSLNVPLSTNVIPAASVTYSWTVDDPNGLGVPLTGSGNTIVQPMSNTLGFQATLIYTITPTGPGPSGGCVGDNKIMVVTVSPQISATFLNNPSPDFICKGSTEFLVFQFGGQALFNFTYDKGGPPINVNNRGNVVVIQDTPLTTTTYTIRSVTDGLGCTTPFNIPFTVNVGDTDPTFSITSPLATCSPNRVSFQYNQVAGTIYTWRFGDSGDSVYTATTTVPNMVIKHTYTNLSPTATLNYPVTMQTSLPLPYPGCFKTTPAKTVTIYPNIIANITSDKTEICSGEQIFFSNQSVGATSQSWSYRVQGQTAETPMGTSVSLSFTFTNTTAANPIIYEIIYRGTNGNCPTPDQIIPIKVFKSSVANFNEGTLPNFVLPSVNVTFTNTSSVLDGAAFNYDWSFGQNSSPANTSGVANQVVNYTLPGPKEISLVVTNKLSPLCRTEFRKTINIPVPPLKASFTATPTESCFPAKIATQSVIEGADIVEWRVRDANGRIAATSSGAAPVFNLPSEGTYTITLKARYSLTGQEVTATPQTVKVYPKPFASFDARPDVVFVPDTELSTFNFSTGANQYEWDFGDGGNSKEEEPKYTYKVEGSYDIRLIAQFDHGNNVVCADTITRKVVARQGGVTKVPNAFTPNPAGPNGGQSSNGGGQFNDVFLPIVKGAEEFNLQIFDRWGNLIFESNSNQIGWDGYDKNGRILPAGVYVYKLTIRLSDGQRSTQIGDVTMIR